MHVVYEACQPSGPQGEFSHDIQVVFRHVQDLVRELGCDPLAWPSVGAIYTDAGQLVRYECCIQVPAGTPLPDREGVAVQDLPGGRFAVLVMDKDPTIIGPSIGRFYGEYVPAHQLAIDDTRPTYELYHARIMEYCVPVH